MIAGHHPSSLLSPHSPFPFSSIFTTAFMDFIHIIMPLSRTSQRKADLRTNISPGLLEDRHGYSILPMVFPPTDRLCNAHCPESWLSLASPAQLSLPQIHQLSSPAHIYEYVDVSTMSLISFSSNSTHPGDSKPSLPSLHLKLLAFHLRHYSLSSHRQSKTTASPTSSARLALNPHHCGCVIPTAELITLSCYLVPHPFLGLQLLSTCPTSFLEHFLHLPPQVPLSLPFSLSPRPAL